MANRPPDRTPWIGPGVEEQFRSDVVSQLGLGGFRQVDNIFHGFPFVERIWNFKMTILQIINFTVQYILTAEKWVRFYLARPTWTQGWYTKHFWDSCYRCIFYDNFVILYRFLFLFILCCLGIFVNETTCHPYVEAINGTILLNFFEFCIFSSFWSVVFWMSWKHVLYRDVLKYPKFVLHCLTALVSWYMLWILIQNYSNVLYYCLSHAKISRGFLLESWWRRGYVLEREDLRASASPFDSWSIQRQELKARWV
jgi:hypothetical protein